MLAEGIYEESKLHIGYIILFVTAVGFICSLTYNYGYFWWFESGVRLLSIGDILTSYSLWVPGLGTLLFGYSLDLFIRHAESNKKLFKTKKYQLLLKKLLKPSHKITLVIMLALLCAFILIGFKLRPLIVWCSICYIWLSLSAYLSSSKFITGRTNRFIFGIFAFVPIILSLMFALGMDKAISDAKLNTANVHLYFFKRDEGAYPAILLRHLEKGLLVKEINQKNYILYTWDELSKVEIVAQQRHFTGLLHL